MLHLAARCGFVPALATVLRFNINPFFRNEQHQLAIDVAANADAKQRLVNYMTWQPETGKQFGQWCGPYFRKRVFALLLMFWRMKNEWKLTIPRDMQTLLIQHVLAVETVFVNAKSIKH